MLEGLPETDTGMRQKQFFAECPMCLLGPGHQQDSIHPLAWHPQPPLDKLRASAAEALPGHRGDGAGGAGAGLPRATASVTRGTFLSHCLKYASFNINEVRLEKE